MRYPARKPLPEAGVLAERGLGRFADGAEELHLFFDLGFDGFEARLEQFAGVIALGGVFAGGIGLAGFAVIDGRLGEDELAVGVDVDLGHAVGDGVLDLVIGDAGAAMEDERDAAGGFLDLHQSVDVETSPVGRIDAVDVADAGSEEVHAESDDFGAFFGIGDFAVGRDAVFGAADGADFGFDGEAFIVGEGDEFAGLGDVFFEGEGGAVEHDRSEAGFDAFLAAFVGAVVEMEGDGDGDAQGFVEGLNHGGDDLEAAHVFASAFADAEDDWGFLFFRSEENGFGPFEVVDVEMPDGVVAFVSEFQHSGGIN